jgi:hypothetical protein
MSPAKQCAHKYAKARRRRYRQVHERLARDRRQAQHAAEALSNRPSMTWGCLKTS